MAIEHRFDFLGINFEPSDVNHAVAPALEVIALIAQFEHVSRVDKTLRVFQHGRILAEIAARCGRVDLSVASTTFKSTPGVPVSMLAGKPDRPSGTSKATPASVVAKAWLTAASG